jgi:hypothetical protein
MKEDSGHAGDAKQRNTNAIPKEVETMSNVINVRRNWGKWTRESRKRNKSRGPVRSPDWYAG